MLNEMAQSCSTIMTTAGWLAPVSTLHIHIRYQKDISQSPHTVYPTSAKCIGNEHEADVQCIILIS